MIDRSLELVERHRTETSSRHLDGQWEMIKPRQQACNPGAVDLVGLPRGSRDMGPSIEQRTCVVCTERLDAVHLLDAEAETYLARGEYTQPATEAERQRAVEQLTHDVDDVFAVVDDDERIEVRQRPHRVVGSIAVEHDVEYPGDRRQHVLSGVDVGELDDVHPVSNEAPSPPATARAIDDLPTPPGPMRVTSGE